MCLFLLRFSVLRLHLVQMYESLKICRWHIYLEFTVKLTYVIMFKCTVQPFIISFTIFFCSSSSSLLLFIFNYIVLNDILKCIIVIEAQNAIWRMAPKFILGSFIVILQSFVYSRTLLLYGSLFLFAFYYCYFFLTL